MGKSELDVLALYIGCLSIYDVFLYVCYSSNQIRGKESVFYPGITLPLQSVHAAIITFAALLVAAVVNALFAAIMHSAFALDGITKALSFCFIAALLVAALRCTVLHWTSPATANLTKREALTGQILILTCFSILNIGYRVFADVFWRTEDGDQWRPTSTYSLVAVVSISAIISCFSLATGNFREATVAPKFTPSKPTFAPFFAFASLASAGIMFGSFFLSQAFYWYGKVAGFATIFVALSVVIAALLTLGPVAWPLFVFYEPERKELAPWIDDESETTIAAQVPGQQLKTFIQPTDNLHKSRESTSGISVRRLVCLALLMTWLATTICLFIRLQDMGELRAKLGPRPETGVTALVCMVGLYYLAAWVRSVHPEGDSKINRAAFIGTIGVIVAVAGCLLNFSGLFALGLFCWAAPTLYLLRFVS